MKWYYIYILFLFSVISCNIFEPRSAENPTVEKSSYKPPTTPDIVIENLTNSISEKNSINYVQCFGGPNLDFSFVPALDSKSNYSTIFLDWNTGSERSYFENMIIQTSKTAASSLTLSNTINQSSSDSVISNSNYVLNFQHSASDIPQTATGNLQFTIKRDKNNNWYITKWIDIKVQSQFSWSDMKARFSN
jgi:hypothetical protein